MGLEPRRLTVYTDGSANNVKGNKDPAGYGAIILDGVCRERKDDEKLAELARVSDFDFGLNSYTAELMAVIIGLHKVSRLKRVSSVLVVTDSKVIYDAFDGQNWMEGWKAKGFTGVKYEEFWRVILQLTNKSFKVNFFWVKGHSNLFWNEEADKLANEARKNSVTNGRRN